MRELSFVITNWLGADEGDDVTLASLRIEAGSGSNQIQVTEVLDTIEPNIRPHINVSAHLIARWLLVNWWRLRWEPSRTTQEWRLAHAMSSIGGGYAWPPLDFSSDGEYIRIHMEAEDEPDVAAIRYLRNVTLDIPARDFESAVDELVSQVQERVRSACQHVDQDMEDLWNELAEERSDPRLSRACRLQAYAGIDPGAAPEGWLEKSEELSKETGREAVYEVMAVLPESGDLRAAQDCIEKIRNSPNMIDLSWVKEVQASADPQQSEIPWERGSRLARDLRQYLGLKTEPLNNKILSESLKVTLPLQNPSRQLLRGGFRNGRTNGRTAVLVPTARLDNQRFYLARLIGCALLYPENEHLLPATNAFTAMQKFERAFAQELLCPWTELDQFTDECGLDDEGIAEAAQHFKVGELLVRSTLVNKKKLPRDRLE